MERKWQVTGKFCNINRTNPTLVRIKLRKIDPEEAKIYIYYVRIYISICICLAIWSGIVTNILSPTLRLTTSFDILICRKCDSKWSIHVRGLSAFKRDILGESLLKCYTIYYPTLHTLAVGAIFAALRQLLYSSLDTFRLSNASFRVSPYCLAFCLILSNHSSVT